MRISQDWTCLHIAIDKRFIELAQLLIQGERAELLLMKVVSLDLDAHVPLSLSLSLSRLVILFKGHNARSHVLLTTCCTRACP